MWKGTTRRWTTATVPDIRPSAQRLSLCRGTNDAICVPRKTQLGDIDEIPITSSVGQIDIRSFLNDKTFSAHQIVFDNMVVEHVTHQGARTAAQLNGSWLCAVQPAQGRRRARCGHRGP